MDFKKCSEVYGYKSIAEVEEEELAEKIESKSYTGFINELADALNEAGYSTASTALENIKLEVTIDNYLALEKDLVAFLDDNSENLNIITSLYFTITYINCQLVFLIYFRFRKNKTKNALRRRNVFKKSK